MLKDTFMFDPDYSKGLWKKSIFAKKFPSVNQKQNITVLVTTGVSPFSDKKVEKRVYSCSLRNLRQAT